MLGEKYVEALKLAVTLLKKLKTSVFTKHSSGRMFRSMVTAQKKAEDNLIA